MIGNLYSTGLITGVSSEKNAEKCMRFNKKNLRGERSGLVQGLLHMLNMLYAMRIITPVNLVII